MNMKKIIILSILAASAAYGAGELKISINPQEQYQTIDNFAAADAWSGNFVGQYFDETQKEQIAKWLFSQKIGKDGNPEGIGLSLWRFNIGGGTLEQDGANILPFHHRAESFLTKDGQAYDWGKCAGQVYFAKKAKEYGCEKLLLFSNTPPVQYTRNGQGYGEKNDNRANLKPDCYGKFADYMATVAQKFGEMGCKVDYISPVNEPQVPWSSALKQEGSPWYNSEMKKLLVELDRALTEKNLDTLICFGEASHPRYLFAGYPYDKPNARWKNDPLEEQPGFMIKNFFDPQSKFYVGNLKHMPKFIVGHSYHVHLKNANMEKIHKSVAEEAKKYGIGYHQSEWCLLGSFTAKMMDNFTEDWNSHNRGDIQTALLIGRIVYSDFVNANALSWGYWKGMEIKGDYALIGVYPVKTGRLEDGGFAVPNKILWGLGNFSFFVRPGFKRVDMLGASDLDGVAGVAFASPDGKRVVAVLVNSSFDVKRAQISLPAKYKNAKARAFRTDANMDLANLWVDEGATEFVVAPRSLTTIVYDL